jgi:hypothetical protein
MQMAEGVFRIEEVQERVVACLGKETRAISHEALVAKVGLPVYALDAGLEAALLAKQVTYAVGQGFWIAPGPARGEAGHA